MNFQSTISSQALPWGAERIVVSGSSSFNLYTSRCAIRTFSLTGQSEHSFVTGSDACGRVASNPDATQVATGGRVNEYPAGDVGHILVAYQLSSTGESKRLHFASDTEEYGSLAMAPTGQAAYFAGSCARIAECSGVRRAIVALASSASTLDRAVRYVLTDLEPTDQHQRAITGVYQTDRRLVAGVRAGCSESPCVDSMLVRFLQGTGSGIDLGFGTNGVSRFPVGFTLLRLAVLSDQHVLAVGTINGQLALIRVWT